MSEPKWLRTRNLPAKLADVLERYESEDTTAMQTVRAWLAADRELLVLSGPLGCGKSYAAAWAVHDGLPGSRWVTSFDLSRISIYHPDLDVLIDAPILAMDDLGVEYGDRKGAFDAMLDGLVSSRLANGLRTVITCNMPVADLRARVGPRLADRIAESGKVVMLTGDSMRQAGVKPTRLKVKPVEPAEPVEPEGRLSADAIVRHLATAKFYGGKAEPGSAPTDMQRDLERLAGRFATEPVLRAERDAAREEAARLSAELDSCRHDASESQNGTGREAVPAALDRLQAGGDVPEEVMSMCTACGEPIVDGACLCIPCPQCGRDVPDLDGFGVIAHLGGDGCGYCSHPSTDSVRAPNNAGLALERCGVCERLLEYEINGSCARLVRVVDLDDWAEATP